MCLALYDKAPRFANSVESINLADVGDNQINQSDVRNLLRRGTTDGYAEVDFLGVDGHRYRSRWSVRRTRNKVSGSLQPQTMEVKELDELAAVNGISKNALKDAKAALKKEGVTHVWQIGYRDTKKYLISLKTHRNPTREQ